MKALDYSCDRLRLTVELALPADTVLSLKKFITNLLATEAHAKFFFANSIQANEAARLALVGITKGYIAYDTGASDFYEFTGTNPATAGHWTVRTIPQLHTYNSFMSNLSWNVGSPSTIGNKTGGNTMYVGNAFINNSDGSAPDKAVLTTYGIAIAAAASREFSGYPQFYYLYSLAGTTVQLDLIFETGAG